MERELVDHCAAGTLFDVSGRPSDQRWIRAAVVYELCVGTSRRVHPKGVQLSGATIDGALDFEYARLRVPLRLQDCNVRDAVTFTSATVPGLDLTGSEIAQPLRLGYATIESQLNLKGAKLTGTDEHHDALAADGLHVGGSFVCERLEAAGTIRLVGATIDQSLVLKAAKLRGTEDRNALDAARIHVGGSALLTEGFEAAGAIVLSDATIESQLSLVGAKLGTDVHNDALAADGLHVGGSFVCERLEAAGTIRLVGATIDQSLVLKAAKLRGTEDRNALDAARIHVGGSALLTEGFEAAGAILLSDATIDSQLMIQNAAVSELRLTGARCTRLEDDRDSWPTSGRLKLQGFRFSELSGHQTAWKQRLDWVRRQGFDAWSPDPYEQLAAHYTSAGDEGAAQQMQIAKNDDELTHLKETKGWRSLWRRCWRRLFGRLVGYGYRRWPVGVFLIVAIVIAGGLFRWAESIDDMVPNEPAEDATGAEPCGTAYPCFNSFIYGADVVLPIIDFGQDDAWRPVETSRGGQWWIWARWVFIALGWVLASVFVAAFTSLVQRS